MAWGWVGCKPIGPDTCPDSMLDNNNYDNIINNNNFQTNKQTCLSATEGSVRGLFRMDLSSLVQHAYKLRPQIAVCL